MYTYIDIYIYQNRQRRPVARSTRHNCVRLFSPPRGPTTPPTTPTFPDPSLSSRTELISHRVLNKGVQEVNPPHKNRQLVVLISNSKQ